MLIYLSMFTAFAVTAAGVWFLANEKTTMLGRAILMLAPLCLLAGALKSPFAQASSVTLQRKRAPKKNAPNAALPAAPLQLQLRFGFLRWPALAFLLAGQTVFLLAGGSAAGLGGGLGLSLLGLALGAAAVFSPVEGVRVGLASLAEKVFLVLAGLAYGIWSFRFIQNSSFDGPGGTGRIFTLFDDAMVSMRYAWNLVEGNGLVWNVGERVEGYTNLLMTLLMSVGVFLLDHLRASAFVQVLGVLLVLGSAWSARLIFLRVAAVRDGAVNQALGAAIFLLVLAYYPLSYWSLLGMEVGLVSVLLLTAMALVVKPGAEEHALLWLPVLLGLAVLSRPDALNQAVLLLGFRAFTLRKQPVLWRRLAAEVGIFALFPVGATLFRLSYYGEWLPNTYFLKLTGLSREIRLQGGWAFTRQYLASIVPLLFLGALGAALRPTWGKSLALLIFGSVVFYQISIGGDPWLYWRFFAPVNALLLVLALDGGASAFELTGRAMKLKAQAWLRPGGLVAAGAVLLAGVGVAASNKAFLPELSHRKPPMLTEYNIINSMTGLHLKKLLKPGGSVGVTWAGTIPYFSERKSIDFLGKCDKYVARRKAEMVGFSGMATVPGHNKYDLNYSIKELKPDFVQTDFWAGDDLAPYCKIHYTRISNLLIANDSPTVDWDLIRAEHLDPRQK